MKGILFFATQSCICNEGDSLFARKSKGNPPMGLSSNDSMLLMPSCPSSFFVWESRGKERLISDIRRSFSPKKKKRPIAGYVQDLRDNSWTNHFQVAVILIKCFLFFVTNNLTKSWTPFQRQRRVLKLNFCMSNASRSLRDLVYFLKSLC